MPTLRPPARSSALVLACCLSLILGRYPLAATQSAAAPSCKLTGKATSGPRPLPGVAIVVRSGERVVAVSSTEVDGSYQITLPPEATYRLVAELTAFARVERDVTVAAPPCELSANLEFTLASRTTTPSTPADPSTAAAVPAAATTTGRGAAAGPRFETLNLQTNATAAAALQVNPPDREMTEAATRLLLPPGFSSEGPVESVAMAGNMASIDRGMMNDRFQALGRGQIDPVTGEVRQVAALDQAGGFGEPGGRGRGGRGGPGGEGRVGGPGGRGGGRGGPGQGGRLGGRGIQQRPYQFTSNYSFGGSALDSAPYQLRPDTPAERRPYARQTFGATVGGPVRLPGLYNGTGRTTFQFTYSGNRGSNLFDQYATVPSEALRAGDFSSMNVVVRDPLTGLPFENNKIPENRIDAGALYLLRFLPEANLPGTTRNFHYTTTTNSSSDNINVRITHNLTPGAGGRGGGGRGGGGGGGRAGGAGRGGRGAPGRMSMNLTAQVQYRRNNSDQINVLPTLGGENTGSSLTVPIGLNIQKNRNTHAINVSVSRSSSQSVNQYAFVENVAGLAGIRGVSTDPYAWGVPTLNFSTFSDLRDLTPSRRSDTRLSTTYNWTRPLTNHTFRIGGDFRQDWSSAETDPNARGNFVFTGLYTAAGTPVPRNAGLDFADFLLGLPQQASIQYGPGNVRLRGRSFSAFFQDDWRPRGNLTVSLGVRYELVWPYLETHGHMVNLDVNPDFTAAAAVLSGQAGAYRGEYPAALVKADGNNVAPRVGLAWRAARGTIVRGGYGVQYNAGSYASIARQLVAQPPFATTNTSLGVLDDPLTLANPFLTATPTTTTNNYGVDPDYRLGVVHTWNADLSRVLGQTWAISGGYTATKGTSLDMVRAPNRGPDGLRIPDVQPFTWQTSEAASMLHLGTVRLDRRAARGIGGSVSYTIARSRDNASTLGGGRTTVAQDDRNLAAEWGLSSFDRRHQLSASVSVELPFGPNRPWLNGGGTWAAIFENWRATTNFTWQSGTPYTPTVTGAVADVAQGVNGSLRANYTGAVIRLHNPTIDQYFNTSAFSVPDSGSYGNAGRNIIIGPGSRLLNASFSRDVLLGNNRTVSVGLSANNLLNLVNYTGIDTNVNSPTFGQVTSVRPMRSMQLNLRFRF